MESLIDYAKELLTMANALKGGFVVLLLFWAKKGVSRPCDKHADIIDRIAKVEAKDDTNILYRKISQDERDKISKLQKHTDYKLDNLTEKFKEFEHSIFEHLQVKPAKRIKILIFDDDPVSSDMLKSKISDAVGKVTFITTNNIIDAKYELKYNKVKYIFSDLYHEKEPLGIDFYAQCQMFQKEIPFILYSCATRPNDYYGTFLPKEDITPELLKTIIK